jgi:oligopeptide/dipeptide ABC transporter ATP-binding protein
MIAHHLAMVRYMSHRVGVMYLGQIVETADPKTLFAQPRHPYTKALISASLPNHPDIERGEIILSGEVPSPADPPAGCRFHTRCWLYQALEAPERCATEAPELRAMGSGHSAACHFAERVSADSGAPLTTLEDRERALIS